MWSPSGFSRKFGVTGTLSDGYITTVPSYITTVPKNWEVRLLAKAILIFLYNCLCPGESPCMHWYAVLGEIVARSFFGTRLYWILSKHPPPPRPILSILETQWHEVSLWLVKTEIYSKEQCVPGQLPSSGNQQTGVVLDAFHQHRAPDSCNDANLCAPALGIYTPAHIHNHTHARQHRITVIRLRDVTHGMISTAIVM